MSRERSFTRRGRQVHLRELTDWVAVRLPPKSTPLAATKSIGRPSKRAPLSIRALDQIAPEIAMPDIRSLEDAGWTLVPRSSPEARGSNIVLANVYVEPGGRVALSTNALTVKFREDLTDRQANEFLSDYCCHVLERMSFAPGLFRVTLAKRDCGDAFDVAEKLHRSDRIESAEPEFIEAIGKR